MKKYVRITHAIISKKCQALTLVEAQRHKDIPKEKKVLRYEETYTHVFN